MKGKLATVHDCVCATHTVDIDSQWRLFYALIQIINVISSFMTYLVSHLWS